MKNGKLGCFTASYVGTTVGGAADVVVAGLTGFKQRLIRVMGCRTMTLLRGGGLPLNPMRVVSLAAVGTVGNAGFHAAIKWTSAGR